MATILVLYLYVSTAVFEGVKEKVSDGSTTARIETIFLFNDHLSSLNINTTTTNGVVTLSGGVHDEIQRQLAGDLAASVAGVTRVVNTITVVPTPPPPAQPRSWRRKVTDKTTSASVRTRLLYNKKIKGLRIGVKTENGVVTLSGVVRSNEQRQRIAKIAFDTKKVERVINRLLVRPAAQIREFEDMATQISEEWLEKRIETAILLNRHLSIRHVDVEVNEGICILTGTVASEPQRDLAGSIAENLHGVDDVQNEIVVRAGLPPELAFIEPEEALPALEEDARETLDTGPRRVYIEALE